MLKNAGIKTERVVARKVQDALTLSFYISMVVVGALIFCIYQYKGIQTESLSEREICITLAAKTLGVPPELTATVVNAFLNAENTSGIDGVLLLALSATEAPVDKVEEDTLSAKGYHGAMQIPIETKSLQSNVLTGASILKGKVAITHGDMRKAIALYKGYGLSEKGLEKADAVLSLYSALRPANGRG